ncbi:hypothetical protein [Bizionia paragorgiae]|jgi:hypothetical protein|uniref:Uncharacterized protein n=1 Tax=Bizionia paragorgiae TaxID=283786 RepID=A0A1H3Y3M6_BIZPA|nr:hypothetical protein [Bizionia paragorgiae]MDX1270844.1 hypothetical protein [Bizionia paragorgiae]SEA06317.1 hypothetical protein SAMN04487990_10641 [Bizionia paragorgiae]
MIKIAVLISLMLAAYLTSEKKCEREENKVVTIKKDNSNSAFLCSEQVVLVDAMSCNSKKS